MFIADNGGCAEEISDGWKGFILSTVGYKHTRQGKEMQIGNDPEFLPATEDTYQSYGIPWANASNTPFRFYKHYIHEGGISSPLVVHWPDKIKDTGQYRAQVGHLIDIMATCVDVSDAKYPDTFKGNDIHPMEGKSLLSAFAGQKPQDRQLFWEHGGNRGMRDGKWKIVARGWNGKWQLYDIQTDRTELNDLAGKHPARVEKMDKMWFDWANRANVIPYEKGQTQ
jgi:arylsulfatase A-like enzyme